jgi:peptidoglycan/xylan/chitin deacetylase (PgdA/CDA1 family)
MGKKALQFHRITPDFQFCGTWNTPAQFERFLKYIMDSSIRVVLPDDPDDGLILTFDDGESNVYEYAFPLLKHFNMKAVVFLIVGYVGKENQWDIQLGRKRMRHLTWEQIREMSEWGIEFGSHTMTHRNLTHLSDETIIQELSLSRKIITDRTGRCRSISYPFNRVNRRVLDAVRSTGYAYGFGSDGSEPLLLKKEAVYITDTVNTLRTKILERPVGLYRYERIKQKVINMFTISTMVLKNAPGEN